MKHTARSTNAQHSYKQCYIGAMLIYSGSINFRPIYGQIADLTESPSN